MNKHQIVRAWKDRSFRSTLSASQRTQLPAHPSGGTFNELDEAELQRVVGAADKASCYWTGLPVTSCGHVCTATTECPVLSICCRDEEIQQA